MNIAMTPSIGVLALVCVAAAAAVPLAPTTLPWSWDRASVFIHGCQCSRVLLNASELAYVAKYHIAVIEKGHGVEETGLYMTDRNIPRVAQQIKGANPKTWVLFYQNPALDFLLYELHHAAAAAEKSGARPFGINTDGTPSVTFVANTYPVGGACTDAAQNYPTGLRIFNMSDAKLRSLFVESCTNATGTGFVDGCHIDRANWAERLAQEGGDHAQGGHQNSSINWTSAQADAEASGQKLVMAALQVAVGPERLISAKENPTLGLMNDFKRTNTMYMEDCWMKGYAALQDQISNMSRAKFNQTLAVMHYELQGAIDTAARGQVTLI